MPDTLGALRFGADAGTCQVGRARGEAAIGYWGARSTGRSSSASIAP